MIYDYLHSAADEHVEDNINCYNLRINNKLDNHCLLTLTVLLWVMQSYHTFSLGCIISPAGLNIPFTKYQESHKSDQLGMYSLS